VEKILPTIVTHTLFQSVNRPISSLGFFEVGGFVTNLAKGVGGRHGG
jgi:hypothetical protein